MEYKLLAEKENKEQYADFDRVDNIKILDMNEEIYQAGSDCFKSSKKLN